MRKLSLLFFVTVMTGIASARQFHVPAQPVSPYADTEVSTNVVVHTGRTDVREVKLHLELEGTPTNDLEVAFGRDVNTNGVLDVSEMETAYGWRAGRYFVENLLSWTRAEECPSATAMPGLLDIDMVQYGDSASWRFTAKCGGEAAFAGFAAMPQSAWLFSRDWDIMRVVRRGAGPATGWVACTLEYPFSFIHVR